MGTPITAENMGKGGNPLLIILAIAVVINLGQFGMAIYTLYLGFHTAAKSYPCSFNDIVVNHGQTLSYPANTPLPPLKIAGTNATKPQKCGTIKPYGPGNIYPPIPPEGMRLVSDCRGDCETMLKYCKVASSQKEAWDIQAGKTVHGQAASTMNIWYKAAYDTQVFPPQLRNGGTRPLEDPDCPMQIDLAKYGNLAGYQTCDRDFTAILNGTCAIWLVQLSCFCCALFAIVIATAQEDDTIKMGALCCVLIAVCASLGTLIAIVIAAVWKGDANCEAFSPDYYSDLNKWFTWVLVLLILGCVCQAGGRSMDGDDRR